MSYFSDVELKGFGFKSLGNDVRISTKASVYDCSKISIEDNVRIDDFCLLSGSLKIGRFTHLAPYCMLAGGLKGICIGSYVTLAYGVKIFSETDDYSGASAVGSLMPENLKKVGRKTTEIGSISLLGTNSIVLPGCNLGEGVALGAATLVTKELDSWWIYIGSPAKAYKPREQKVKKLVREIIEAK